MITNVHDVKSRELNCSVRLAAPGTFPMVALASPPGAGNTWTRHLIQQATGFYTGSQYRYQVLADTERNRRETINQTGMVAWNSSLRNDREWFSVLEWQVHLYERFVNNWIGIGKPILVVHYENIKEDAVRELRRVVKFLNLTVDNERLECVRGNIEGNYHRKYSDKSQLYRDVLPPPIKRYAQMVMERVSDFLVEHGQDPVPWQNIPTGILPNT
ncbi:sialate:O-sulfotransferase 1-like isoform X2 [Ptychodera flava]|uniref:sialate:O-sulfotransferase 1-like isoform X2 n=1 Tax=Ptychodera flava TaxID=63121 RepID=UPI003969E3D9